MDYLTNSVGEPVLIGQESRTLLQEQGHVLSEPHERCFRNKEQGTRTKDQDKWNQLNNKREQQQLKMELLVMLQDSLY